MVWKEVGATQPQSCSLLFTQVWRYSGLNRTIIINNRRAPSALPVLKAVLP